MATSSISTNSTLLIVVSVTKLIEFDMHSVPSLGLEDETKKLWETQVMISYSLTEKSFCRSVPPYQQSLSIFFQVLRKKSLLSMMISLKWIS